METTMAATPKARLATGSAPSSEDLVTDNSGLLPFPVPPPPPNTARMMPAFAFPPANDPQGATRAQPMPPMRPTRRTTVRVPRRGGEGPLGDALAGLASFVENAPLPALPEEVWTAIGRAWFFMAGTTAGILLALALIAISGPKHALQREARTSAAQGTARVLVVERAPTAADRGIGQLAENDTVRPAPIVARRSPGASRRAPGKDILSAGL